MLVTTFAKRKTQQLCLPTTQLFVLKQIIYPKIQRENLEISLGVYITSQSAFELLPRRHPPNPKGLHQETRCLSNCTSVEVLILQHAAWEKSQERSNTTLTTQHTKKAQIYLTIESERLQIAIGYRELLCVLD